jgi:hypothetical protein
MTNPDAPDVARFNASELGTTASDGWARYLDVRTANVRNVITDVSMQAVHRCLLPLLPAALVAQCPSCLSLQNLPPAPSRGFLLHAQLQHSRT